MTRKMDGFSKELKLIFLLLLLIAVANQLKPAELKNSPGTQGGEIRLDQSVFNAQGENETLLHVKHVGRYSIQVNSPQGTRIEIIDHMQGPFLDDGIAGERDGRIDLFLDTGTYKIRLYSFEKGSGKATLKVLPFKNVNPTTHIQNRPFVPHLDMISGQLDDLQQHSFWLYIKERQTLRLEMIGRNLSNALLWRDGAWLEDIQPTTSKYEPISGQPMTYIEFHHELNPGLYLLICYGGPPHPWAKETNDHPFHLREGIPTLGRDGQKLLKISPFGRDTFQIDPKTNFFQLVRQDKKNSALDVYFYNLNQSRFHNKQNGTTIDKNSRDPWCITITQCDSCKNPWWVTITTHPGDPVELDFFFRQWTATIIPQSTPTRYWISTIHSAAGRDAIDATAIITGSHRQTPLDANVVEVKENTPLVRKINLIDSFSVFLYFQEGGTYLINENPQSGALGRYQFKPFLLYYPANFTPPPFNDANQPIEINPGYYILTVQPKTKGILHFALHKDYFVTNKLVEKILTESPQTGTSENNHTQHGITFPDIEIPAKSNHPDESYQVVINERSGVDSGIITRQLPINLQDSLPVLLEKGQSVIVKIHHKEKMNLEISGGKFKLTLDQTPYSLNTPMTPGSHELTLENTDDSLRLYNLHTSQADVTPPPAPVIKSIEEIFPTLAEKNPLFTDFDYEENQSFLLKVTEPALYRLETTGRLATAMTVRTRTVTSMFTADQNGIGRNGLIQQYLNPGDYLVNISTKGNSSGRAGIVLRRTPLINGDSINEGTIIRDFVAADSAIRYPIHITEPGRYLLQTLSPGKDHKYRLEDHHGWPLLTHGLTGAIDRHFSTGQYYYYTLPDTVENRRITFLKRIFDQPVISGKGPHPLNFNQPLENTWLEDDKNSPDIYQVLVPAPLQAELTLDNHMDAHLFTSQDQAIATTKKGYWKGTLNPDSYSIHVFSKDKNNHQPYSIHLQTPDLVPGINQTLEQLPGTLQVGLGKAGLIDISSFGSVDVKAVLMDENARQTLATGDDRKNDWNFRISKNLPAGQYRLEVLPADQFNLPVEIRMKNRTDISIPQQTLPFSLNQKINQEYLTIPFNTDSTPTLLYIHSQQATSIKLALYKKEKLLAECENELIIPLNANETYTLLTWNEGETNVNLSLKAIILSPENETLDSQGKMVTLEPAMQINNPLGFSFYLQPTTTSSTPPPIFYSPLIERPCLPIKPGLVENTGDKTGWLVTTAKKSQVNIHPLTIKIQDHESLELMLNELHLAFTLESQTDQPVLVTVRSINSITGFSIFPFTSPIPQSASQDIFRRTGMLATTSRTLMGIPPRGLYRAYTWNTAPTPPITSENERYATGERLVLDFQSFPKQNQADLKDLDTFEAEVKPGQSFWLDIPGFFGHVDLTLGKGLVAFSWNNAQPFELLAALDDNRVECIATNNQRLYILNTSVQPTRFRVEKKDVPFLGVYQLNQTRGYETYETQDGRIEFILDNLPPNQRLFIAGTDFESHLWNKNGKIVTGTPATVPTSFLIQYYDQPSGILEIQHKPGFIKVWTGNLDDNGQSFSQEIKQAKKGTFKDNFGTLTRGSQIWDIKLDKPCLISAETETPSLMGLFSNQLLLTLSASPYNKTHRLIFYLPAGNYQLWTYVLPGLHLPRVLQLKTITPVELDENKTMDYQLINPDEIQAFHFTVFPGVKGNIGLGLETENDSLNATVYDEQSHLIATGPLIVQSLKPGSYLFVVQGGTTPVQYRPIILGHRGSRQDVPHDVIKQYEEEAKQ